MNSQPVLSIKRSRKRTGHVARSIPSSPYGFPTEITKQIIQINFVD